MSEQGASRDPPLVVCEDIERTYARGADNGGRFGRLLGRGQDRRDRSTVTAVDGVTLRIDGPEWVALYGPSGSGKSTLLHLIGALDIPTAGRVEVLGRDVTTMTERQRTRLRLDSIGFVFQRFYLLASLSARANVALPLIEQGLGKAARRDRAEELLERVGLEDRVTHRPGELSGGEQQRVAVARAIATEPAVVIADEPTGELDTETGDRILDILDDLAETRAVIVASHDANVIERADRTVHLRDGRIQPEP